MAEFGQNNSNSTSVDNSSTVGQGPSLPDWLPVFDTIWLISYMIEKAVGFSANLLTVVAVLKYEKLWKQPTNIWVASLAVADCMNFLAAPFECIVLSNVLNVAKPSHLRLMNICCYILSIFGILSFCGNISHIFIIALERFLSVNFPLYMRGKLTIRSAKITAFVTWSLIIVKLTLDFIFLNNGMGFSFCLWHMVFKHEMYNNTILIPFIIISCLTLMMYMRIAFVTMKRSKKKVSELDWIILFEFIHCSSCCELALLVWLI